MPNPTPDRKEFDPFSEFDFNAENQPTAPPESEPPEEDAAPDGSGSEGQARRLEKGRIARQIQEEDEEPGEDEVDENDEDSEGETAGETGAGKSARPDQVTKALTQIRWRYTLWVQALYGCWMFLPLLPVLFHKLSTDGLIASAVRQSASPSSQLAKFSRLAVPIMTVEWIVIILLILLFAVIYLTVVTIIALAAFCLTSPVECSTQGLQAIVDWIGG